MIPGLPQVGATELLILLRACANRRVTYVSRSNQKAAQSLREMSCAESYPPIGAASKPHPAFLRGQAHPCVRLRERQTRREAGAQSPWAS